MYVLRTHISKTVKQYPYKRTFMKTALAFGMA